MSKRLEFVDNEGYTLEVAENHPSRTKELLKANRDLDAIFISITTPNEIQECVALTIEQTMNLINGLQRLIESFED